MLISVEVDPPTRSDRRISRIVGSIGATIVVGLVAMSLSHGDPAPAPSPTPGPSFNAVVDTLSASQETYVLYASWLNSDEFAACMKARGFSREAVAGAEHSRVELVAAFLGVEPRRPDSWLAPAEARNGQPASPRARAADLNLALEDTSQGGCRGPQGTSSLGDAAAVRAAVEVARNDPGFDQYLAESTWLSANPADALLYQSHLLIAAVDPGAPNVSDKWLGPMAATMKTLDARAGWSEGPSEGYADFAQSVAIAPDGSMVIVRVGEPSAIETGFVSNLARPMISCGPMAVVVGTVAHAQLGTDSAEPYNALVTGCVSG